MLGALVNLMRAERGVGGEQEMPFAGDGMEMQRTSRLDRVEATNAVSARRLQVPFSRLAWACRARLNDGRRYGDSAEKCWTAGRNGMHVCMYCTMG